MPGFYFLSGRGQCRLQNEGQTVSYWGHCVNILHFSWHSTRVADSSRDWLRPKCQQQQPTAAPPWAWHIWQKWRPHAKMRLVGRRQAENNLCNTKKNALRQTVKIFMHLRRIARVSVCVCECGLCYLAWRVVLYGPISLIVQAFTLTVNGPTLRWFEYFADKFKVY